jgi:hypothetical protein
MPAILAKDIKKVSDAWDDVVKIKNKYVEDLAKSVNDAADEKKKWKTFLSSLDEGLSGKILDLQKMKADKVPAACTAILEITGRYKTKLKNYANSVHASWTTFRSANSELSGMITKIETDIKKLKADPTNAGVLAQLFKHGKNWSTTKKNETTMLETHWDDKIVTDKKSVKLSKDLIDTCSKYVSSSILEKFKLLDDSLGSAEQKSTAGKLLLLAETMLKHVVTFENGSQNVMELASLRVESMDLRSAVQDLIRRLTEIKG